VDLALMIWLFFLVDVIFGVLSLMLIGAKLEKALAGLRVDAAVRMVGAVHSARWVGSWVRIE
jgi:hypothetical protein